MRQIVFLFFALLFIGGQAGAQQQVVLNIYHTNDSHSRIEPLADNYPDTKMAGKAGVVRRVTLMDSLRMADPDLLLFDCGDFSQGSPYYNLFKGSTEVDFLNLCHYDAGTIGNHEFDFGMDNMVRIFTDARFPIVCANYDVKGTVLESVVKPYVILHRKGLKIGVFGLGPRLEGLVQEKNYRGITFLNPVTCAEKTASLLKEQEHCDVVICLSHLGWFFNPSNEYGDEYMVAHSKHIDLVLGGHTHTYMNEPRWVENKEGRPVPCFQVGKNAQYIGHVQMIIEK